VPALLIGGELHGVFVQVRLGLAGLPPALEFPIMRGTAAQPFEFEFIDGRQRPLFDVERYRLYDDVPAKYLHESEWGGNDDDDGPHEDDPVPRIPDVLLC